MTAEQIAQLVKMLQDQRTRTIDTSITEAQHHLYRCAYWNGHADAYKAVLEWLEIEGIGEDQL